MKSVVNAPARLLLHRLSPRDRSLTPLDSVEFTQFRYQGLRLYWDWKPPGGLPTYVPFLPVL